MTLFPALFLIGMFIRGKNRKAGAIYDLLWSAGLLIYAFSVISDGGQLLLWGIELPNVVIVGIVLVIMVSEIFSLIAAFREPSEEEKLAELNSAPAREGTEPVENNASAKIKLVRGSKFVCNAVAYEVELNGRKYGYLTNGQTIVLLTREKHNVLALSCGLKQHHEVEFDAEPGREYTVNLDVAFSDFTLALQA